MIEKFETSKQRLYAAEFEMYNVICAKKGLTTFQIVEHLPKYKLSRVKTMIQKLLLHGLIDKSTEYVYNPVTRRPSFVYKPLMANENDLPNNVKTCFVPCKASDWRKGGLCDINGCFSEDSLILPA